MAIKQIYQRLRSFITHNVMLYANFLLLFAVLFNTNIYQIVIGFVPIFIAYVFVGIGGYFLNDIFDFKQDITAKKFNITKIISPTIVVVIIIICWATGIILVHTVFPYLLWLVCIQFVLLMLYSIPPFRLKEAGKWGIVIDASYAHLLPELMLLAYLNQYIHLPFFVILFPLFTFLLGVRDILIHQINDYANDELAGVNTLIKNNHSIFLKIIYHIEIAAALLLVLFVYGLGIIGTNYTYIGISVTLLLSYIFLYFTKTFNTNQDTLVKVYVVVSSFFIGFSIIIFKSYYGLLLLAHPYLVSFLKAKLHWLFIRVKYIFKVLFGELFIHIIPLFLNNLIYRLGLLFGRNFKQHPLYHRSNEINLITWLRKLFS